MSDQEYVNGAPEGYTIPGDEKSGYRLRYAFL
jgi:hypothetical protein